VGLSPVSGKRSFPSQNRADRFWDKSSLLLSWIRASSPGVKQAKRDTDHSSPSSAEVTNEHNYISTPPTRPHVVDGKNYTFTFTAAAVPGLQISFQ
jgi:hypothetical protein